MSSSEENYDLDDVSGEESEGFSPVAKKTVSILQYQMVFIHRLPFRLRRHPKPSPNLRQRPLRSLKQLPRKR